MLSYSARLKGDKGPDRARRIPSSSSASIAWSLSRQCACSAPWVICSSRESAVFRSAKDWDASSARMRRSASERAAIRSRSFSAARKASASAPVRWGWDGPHPPPVWLCGSSLPMGSWFSCPGAFSLASEAPAGKFRPRVCGASPRAGPGSDACRRLRPEHAGWPQEEGATASRPRITATVGADPGAHRYLECSRFAGDGWAHCELELDLKSSSCRTVSRQVGGLPVGDRGHVTSTMPCWLRACA